MRTLLILLCFIGFSTHTFAQKIQVLDEENQDPISAVAVYNSEKTKTGITDFDGFVDISKFSNTETINFQHIYFNHHYLPAMMKFSRAVH